MEQVAFSGARLQVRRPRIITASSVHIGQINTESVEDYLFSMAAKRELRQLDHEIDLLYAHFFYPSGRAASRCSLAFHKPCIVAHGDDSVAPWHLDKGRAHFENVAGVVAVSKRNTHFCSDKFRINADKVSVFPNGVDHRLFYPRDRISTRANLNLPLDAKIIAFVGHFIERKGPDRVLAAIETLDKVFAILIGEGPIKLSSDRLLFSGVVGHDRLPDYLSAADLFVLPTTGEGSCNAILEAMACGIPVISSKGDFNDDILTPEVSIRVDPMNIREIRLAVEELLDDPCRRRRMAERCIAWSKRFSIEGRARGIIDWAVERIAAWQEKG
jgi:glycosyltransferase involved in cell wall biosynthesis